MYDWMASTPNIGQDFQVNDGSAIKYNCTDTNHDQWTYNYGTMIMGSAYMYSIVSFDSDSDSTYIAETD
jgi:mannan endo-1,6-alpha-mannosidase